MLNNPSYLIKSRHDIYYFRYPLPTEAQGKSNRVSISLKTRCPREALRLAKALEYHSVNLVEGMDLRHMNHADIMSIFKDYYAEVLERAKARIDKEGQLSKQNVNNITKHLKELDALIKSSSDDELELLGLDKDNPEDSLVHKDLKPIIEKYELDFEPESKEYAMMSAAYKFARRNYFNDLLSYNSQVMDYSLLVGQTGVGVNSTVNTTVEYQLQNVIAKYVGELKGKQKLDSLKDKKDCLGYLTDLLGDTCPINAIDGDKARYVKDQLMLTPTHRNKKAEIKGLPILKQIEVAEELGLDTISDTSVNKYLSHYSGLCEWALRNKYLKENPFKGMFVTVNKKQQRRNMFSRDEIQFILCEVLKGTDGLAKDPSKYWGTLLALYTGARCNEIASLLPDDVKKHDETGIWYIQIEDEEEQGKGTKTAAANRIVPLHSRLIELGFLEYVREARKTTAKMPDINGYRPRLLYNMSCTQSGKWGRKLSQFVNGSLLPKLGIHAKNKKTLHSLRHSFITFLSVAQVDSVTIKSMAGHEQGTVTESIYTHFGIEHLQGFKDAIEKLGY